MFLLNYSKNILHDIRIEKDMEELKNEQAVSECKEWRSLIKPVVGRNITALSKKNIMSGLNMEKL